jgi:chorismate mutase
MFIRGIRGATTVAENTEEAIIQETTRMLAELMSVNGIEVENLQSALFTITPDVTRISPAKVARMNLAWNYVPMMVAQEAVVEGLPPLCIRVLVQVYTDRPQAEFKHVYQNEAVKLRPDWVQGKGD